MDELTKLVNEYRELEKNGTDLNDTDKLEEISDKIWDILSESEEKIIIKGYFEREVCMKDFCFYDWIIDKMVGENKSQQEILVEDVTDNIDDYVELSAINITIEDKNGNRIEPVDL